ncbi:MAG: hypothetical protein QM483_08030 [Desulfuromusa sp.]
MLVSDAVIKFFPALVSPDLTRKKSKSHWRGKRNKSRREKAAAVLAEQKDTVISKRLIHGKEDIPVLEICDDDIDVCITKQYDTVDIEISNKELLACDIEIEGNCREEDLIVLIENLIVRIANQIPQEKGNV